LKFAQVEQKKASIFIDFVRLFSKKLKNEDVFTGFRWFFSQIMRANPSSSRYSLRPPEAGKLRLAQMAEKLAHF
jgi:hypothetical protein